MTMLPPAIIRTNHKIFTPSERSRHASQQKNVRNPKYASYSVAMAHGLAANDGSALHRLTCKLVRTVITTMNRNMKPNSNFRKSFIVLPFDELRRQFVSRR